MQDSARIALPHYNLHCISLQSQIILYPSYRLHPPQVVLGNFVSAPIPGTFIKEIPIKGNIIGIVGACAAAGIVVILLLGLVCLLHKRRVQQKKQFKHLMLHVSYTCPLLLDNDNINHKIIIIFSPWLTRFNFTYLKLIITPLVTTVYRYHINMNNRRWRK